MKSKYLVIISIIIVLGIIIGMQRKPPKDELNLSSYDVATFAGGCFWCMEAAFESAEGVVESISGYTGEYLSNPTYEQVTRGDTGHFEAIQVYYEPDKINYNELLEVFWKNIDPTDDSGQFVDQGTQYKTAIFFHDINQKNQAETSKKELEASGRFNDPIVTEIIEFTEFYEAEDYHQDYYKKRVLNYELYSEGSGRKEFIEENWENKKLSQ